MKTHELPKQYQRLARKNFREQDWLSVFRDDLEGCFAWHLTPEGIDFWSKCHEAKTKDELPPIPEE